MTLPNFPAEIRAPQGTLPGVSSFQVHFADHDILTADDAPDGHRPASSARSSGRRTTITREQVTTVRSGETLDRGTQAQCLTALLGVGGTWTVA